jgi:hypothetical protein
MMVRGRTPHGCAGGSPAMTLYVYSSLFDVDLDAVAGRLDAAVRSSRQDRADYYGQMAPSLPSSNDHQR